MFPNAKRVAGRAAQRAMTYRRGATPEAVARSLGPAKVGITAVAQAIAPVVRPASRSAGRVVYAQLPGETERSLGAMVIVRRRMQDERGLWRSQTRVVDVRLRRSGGSWSLDRIGSVGGTPPRRARRLSPAARRVLDHPNLVLPDTARWDVMREKVSSTLLRALARAADSHRLSVSVLHTGHPANVWRTTRRSAHTKGEAADIWAVDGRPVVEQRRERSPAYTAAAGLLADGARQVGSPWVLGPGPPRSFTDAVHDDHLHLDRGA